MEQVAGIEPALSAWKAEVIAIIPYLHIWYFLLLLKIPNNQLKKGTVYENFISIYLLYQKFFKMSNFFYFRLYLFTNST